MIFRPRVGLSVSITQFSFLSRIARCSGEHVMRSKNIDTILAARRLHFISYHKLKESNITLNNDSTFSTMKLILYFVLQTLTLTVIMSQVLARKELVRFGGSVDVPFVISDPDSFLLQCRIACEGSRRIHQKQSTSHHQFLHLCLHLCLFTHI